MSNVLELLNDATTPGTHGEGLPGCAGARDPLLGCRSRGVPRRVCHELSDLDAELEGISMRENFARGFRLGARLMLEALGQDT